MLIGLSTAMMDGDGMVVYCRNGDDSRAVEVKPGTNVGDLRALAAEQFRIDGTSVRLLFGGRELTDDRQGLADEGICAESEVIIAHVDPWNLSAEDLKKKVESVKKVRVKWTNEMVNEKKIIPIRKINGGMITFISHAPRNGLRRSQFKANIRMFDGRISVHIIDWEGTRWSIVPGNKSKELIIECALSFQVVSKGQVFLRIDETNAAGKSTSKYDLRHRTMFTNLMPDFEVIVRE